MKAMILCAGRGQRLRPLTDRLPKPLITVGGETLLGRHLRHLATAGFRDVVVNVAHLGDRISAYLNKAHTFDLNVRVIDEGQALETGGGMLNALPMLGPTPFAVLNGDIWTDYALTGLAAATPALAHLVLVANPTDKLTGDFGLTRGNTLSNRPSYTYSGIAVIHPQLLSNRTGGKFSITPLLRQASDRGLASGELHRGLWFDIGTPARLAHARREIDALPHPDRQD